MNLIEAFYGGRFYSIDFMNNAASVINKWVSRNTDGLITDLVSDLDSMVKLVNVIYFIGKWETIFNPVYTTLQLFRTSDGLIEFPLKEIMTKLNMTDMFEARKANLSELAEHLHVNDCIQKVVLDIDEEGTVAAAATTMSCGLLCSRPQPIDFKVDRPFLSMIRDDATGLDLFLGTVTDMST
ncbi:antithrombin-III-like [Saccoglossus kowalevskii]